MAKRKQMPAKTPEARENQLVNLAVEETERLFNEVKEQILNKEYEKAKEGFERIFYEEIPSDAIIKMAQLGENELNINMETWCQNFIRTGKGFHMLIYQYI